MNIEFSMPCLEGDAPIDIRVEGLFTQEGVFVLFRAMYASINLTSILHTTGYPNICSAAYNNISNNQGFRDWQEQGPSGFALDHDGSHAMEVMIRARLVEWMKTSNTI